jgi:sporulation related protein
MRTVFFVLLLGNAAFFAWSWFASAASGEAQLLQQQMNPEAIRLLTPEQVAKAAAKPAPPPRQTAQVPKPPETEAAKPQAGKTADTQAAAKPAEAVKVAACMELGAFNPADVQKVEQALVPLALGQRLSQRRVEETAGYWVFVPPQVNRQGANRKVAELKKLGVGEFFVVLDDPEFRFAISLGVFKSREAARSRLAELRAKGVKTARVGAREMLVPKVFFTVREVPEPVAARLNEVRQTFPGAELRECPSEKRAGPVSPV